MVLGRGFDSRRLHHYITNIIGNFSQPTASVPLGCRRRADPVILQLLEQHSGLNANSALSYEYPNAPAALELILTAPLSSPNEKRRCAAMHARPVFLNQLV